MLPLADRVVELQPNRPANLVDPEARVELAAGEVLFEQGDFGDLVFMVESGCVELFRVRPDGSEEPFRDVGPGDWFGEMGPTFKLPRSASARARSPSVVIGSTVQEFRNRRHTEQIGRDVLMSPPQLDGVEVIAFRDAAAWESWLAAHHELQAGVWLKMAKKGSGIASVTDDEVVDIGLCYGWVSGQRRVARRPLLPAEVRPRRPRSLWSRVNVDKVETLLAAGRMREPGMAEVRAAQADGRWDAAYASQKNATVPADVVAALEGNKRGEGRLRLAGQDVPVPPLPAGPAGEEPEGAGRPHREADRQPASGKARPRGRRRDGGSWTPTPMPFAGSGSDT